MPVYKRCSRCGKRILEGSRCECTQQRYKEYDKTRNKKHKEFYGSGEWQTVANLMRLKYQGFDVYELCINNLRIIGQTVHHVVPLEDNWEMRFQENNLILLSESNHRKFHSLMNRSETDKQAVIDMLSRCVREYNHKFE